VRRLAILFIAIGSVLGFADVSSVNATVAPSD
jgi:hypothetical protein